MAYIPTADDFKDVPSSGGYTPTAADFADVDSGSSAAPSVFDQLSRLINSGLTGAAKETAKSPAMSKILQGAGDAAGHFNRNFERTPIPGISHGIVQGYSDMASSISNAPLEIIDRLFGTKLAGQAPDLSKYGNANPLESGVGQAIPNLLGYSGIEKGIRSAIPDFEGLLKYVPAIAAGSGSAALIGENMPGGRLGSAALGGGIAPIGEASSDFMNALSQYKNLASAKDALAREDALGLPDKRIADSQQSIENLLESTKKSFTRGNIVDALSAAKKATFDYFKEGYNKFSKGEIGQRLIDNPLSPDDMSKYRLSDLRGTTLNNIPKWIGRAGRRVESQTGKSFQMIGARQARPTVKDYIDLNRELKNTAGDLRYRSTDPAARERAGMSAEEMLDKAGRIDKISDDVSERIKNVLTPEEQKEFEGLNTGYRNVRMRFVEEPFLRNAAAATDGEVKGSSFIDKLSQPKFDDLKAFMRDKVGGSDLNKAIASHDVANLNLESPKAIGKVLQGDLGDILPSDLKSALDTHMMNLTNKQDMAQTQKLLNYELGKFKKLNAFKSSVLPTAATVLGANEALHQYHNLSGFFSPMGG